MQPGIYWVYGYMYEGGISPVPAFPSQPVMVLGSSSSSINASTSLNKLSADPSVFDIVYQSGTVPSNVIDAELFCYYNGSSWVTSQPYTSTISSGSGYLNYQPSMVQMPDDNIRVCWIRDLYGGGSSTPYYVNAVYWNSASPSVFNYSGNMVNSVSINSPDSTTVSNTFFAYAQNTNNSNWQNFAGNGSSAITLSTTGRNIQLSNGSSSANMYASAYYPVSLPYYFQTSNSLGGLQKSAAAAEDTYGRGVVLGNDNLEFSYSIKSLKVDKSSVNFVEIPLCKDTMAQKRRMQRLTLDSLNTLLLSEPFTIQNGSTISICEGGGFIKSSTGANSSAPSTKDYNVNCTIELINDATGNSMGTVKQTQFTSNAQNPSNLISSNVTIGGNNVSRVRLKMTLSTNITGARGMYVNEYNTVNDTILSKLAAKDMTLQEKGIITTYALEQNYPNPFNPSTTINYQIPPKGVLGTNDNYVTLKIYDILGNVVRTLVDGYKTQGKYSVNFDASSLASGVYFYRLTAGSFNSIKKMLLLK